MHPLGVEPGGGAGDPPPKAIGSSTSQPSASGYAVTGQAIDSTMMAMTMYDIGLTRKSARSRGVDSGTGELNGAFMMPASLSRTT